MEIPTQLRCLFGGAVEQRDGTYLIEVPEQEIEIGDLQSGETYRVAVLGSPTTDEPDETTTDSQRERTPSTPPVAEVSGEPSKSRILVIRGTGSRVLSVASSSSSLRPSAASVSPSKSQT
jgi:hypothetical protein